MTALHLREKRRDFIQYILRAKTAQHYDTMVDLFNEKKTVEQWKRWTMKTLKYLKGKEQRNGEQTV